MHLLAMMVMALGALVVLLLGLSSVLRDLLERSPHEPPLLEEDGLDWPPRYQGIRASAAPRPAPADRWTATPGAGHSRQT